MKKVLVLLALVIGLAGAAAGYAGQAQAGYVQGAVYFGGCGGSCGYANGYTVHIQFNWPAIGWGYYADVRSGVCGSGCYSAFTNVGPGGQFRARVCEGGYSSSWTYSQPYLNGYFYISSMPIYQLYNGC